MVLIYNVSGPALLAQVVRMLLISDSGDRMGKAPGVCPGSACEPFGGRAQWRTTA